MGYEHLRLGREAPLTDRLERRMALEQYEHGKPARIRERLEKRVMELCKLWRG